MHLTDHDLLQLDRDVLARLDEEALRGLSGHLLDDLKEAIDRLNQDSKNSAIKGCAAGGSSSAV